MRSITYIQSITHYSEYDFIDSNLNQPRRTLNQTMKMRVGIRPVKRMREFHKKSIVTRDRKNIDSKKLVQLGQSAKTIITAITSDCVPDKGLETENITFHYSFKPTIIVSSTKCSVLFTTQRMTLSDRRLGNNKKKPCQYVGTCYMIDYTIHLHIVYILGIFILLFGLLFV